MLQEENLKRISSKLTSQNNDFMSNLRHNLNLYTDDPFITTREIAEASGLSMATLNTIIYGDSKDCKLSTVIALAKALHVTVDELTGAGTIPESAQEYVHICRQLPEHALHAVSWYIRHQQSLCKMQPKDSHIISVMHPRVNNNGNLKISGKYSAADISGIDREICRKIFWGLQLDVDFYMPIYSPYDILLVANDRTPTSSEDSVIILDDNLFLAKRKVEDGVAKYYSIRDGKFRVNETECDEVIGYIAYTLRP